MFMFFKDLKSLCKDIVCILKSTYSQIKQLFKEPDEQEFFDLLNHFKDAVKEEVFEVECGKYFVTEMPSVLPCWLSCKSVKAPKFRTKDVKTYGIREISTLESKELELTIQTVKNGLPRLKSFKLK